VALHVQLHKVQQGAFSNTAVEFCGWRFAGGYIGISPTKITSFKEKIALLCTTTIQTSAPGFIKKINQKINGFGHYYKFGHIHGVFAKLDANIRQQVRLAFKLNGKSKPTATNLKNMGLRSLVAIKKSSKPLEAAKKDFNIHIAKKENHQTSVFFSYLETLTNQNTEIIEQLKKITKLLTV